MRFCVFFFFFLAGSFIQNAYSQQSSINFIEEREAFKELNDVIHLEQFKDKVLYIDIWGTKCPPCLIHFNYLPELKERFKGEPIEYIYLCSTYRNINNDSIWRSTVLERNIDGYHILITEEFYINFWENEMKDLVQEDRKWGIPFYLIFDKKGKLAIANARGPNDKEKLYEQLESVLNK